MNRLAGLILAVVLIVVARSAEAQVPANVGGFGFGYTQAMPSNSYVLDRWWMVQATPTVGSALPPQGVVQQPAAQPANPRRVRRAARLGRSLTRVSARPYYYQVASPVTSPLPTGSLYWPSAGMPLYSPAQRMASYGQGYGVSPYGSADYGAQYKGMYWGY